MYFLNNSESRTVKFDDESNILWFFLILINLYTDLVSQVGWEKNMNTTQTQLNYSK